MIRVLNSLVAISIMFSFACAAYAGGHAKSWTLDNENSKIAFGSIKKDKVGEIHKFEKVSGTVSTDGSVSIDIDLSSVQTNIDIRNERMMEHVFKGVATAKLSAKIDMETIAHMSVGDTSIVDVEGALSFLGQNIDVETEMFVARISDDKVMITTNDMIFLGTEDAGIDSGVTKLMELAKLPAITRTSPVTLRLVFNADTTQAGASSATATSIATEIALVGDPKKGKKIFKKCKACHSVKADKNGAGPTLYGVMDAEAAKVEGFNYSKALKGSGLIWDVATLTTFLKKPKDLVPGTKMSFSGLKKEKDIEDLIAYLAEATK